MKRILYVLLILLSVSLITGCDDEEKSLNGNWVVDTDYNVKLRIADEKATITSYKNETTYTLEYDVDGEYTYINLLSTTDSSRNLRCYVAKEYDMINCNNFYFIRDNS